MSGKKRMLVIEDSKELQSLLQQLFETEGYEVFSAYDGQQALDHLQKSAEVPNVILLDLMMPIMDGFEFREKQKEDPRLAAIPTIIMTAHGDALIEQIKMDVLEVLRKPILLENLLKAVAESTSTA